MRWLIIDKAKATVPTSGAYTQWKAQLAREGNLQCVYCCIHEAKFGGIRNFHVEHYRPKSLFPDLENAYSNLFYACGVCNIFKSDDWPAEHEVGRYDFAAYPDPSLVDYGEFLAIDDCSGMAGSQTFLGNYLIERLHLNRPQMVGLRAMSALFSRLYALQAEIKRLFEADLIADSDKNSVIEILLELGSMARKYSEARPYGSDQLR